MLTDADLALYKFDGTDAIAQWKTDAAQTT